MGESTNIAWTQHTWNPWIGCHQVSPGCAHCYALTMEERYGRDFSTLRKSTTWRDPAKWQRAAEAAGRQELVFTCSLSDFFHEDADQWRDAAWDVIRLTPNLTYQILTKRPERIKDHLPDDWGQGYPNVWLGTSVENQYWADRRIPILASIPARVRFLSMEPLLGKVDIRQWLGLRCPDDQEPYEDVSGEWSTPAGELNVYHAHDEGQLLVPAEQTLSWCIVGGESGPNRRPMDLEWARGIQRQCTIAGVPFFFKQVSAFKPGQGEDALGQVYHEMPEAAR